MKFFLALLASQQTLAESGVDGSCVAEEVSLLQSRHSAAKENVTVQVAAGRRRSARLQNLYLSAPGAPECVGATSVHVTMRRVRAQFDPRLVVQVQR